MIEELFWFVKIAFGDRCLHSCAAGCACCLWMLCCGVLLAATAGAADCNNDKVAGLSLAHKASGL